MNKCVLEKNKSIRRRMLLTKIENENQMVELRGMVKGIHDKHFKDLSKLRKMREKVDKLQREYDDSIS